MQLKLLLLTIIFPSFLYGQMWTNVKAVAAPDLPPLEMFRDSSNNLYVFGNSAEPMQRSWYVPGEAEFSKYDADRTRVNHIKWTGIVISDVIYDSPNFYFSGTFTGTVTIGSFVLQSAGENDVFVAKMDTSGQVLFAKRAGGVNPDQSGGVGRAADGNILFAAAIRGPAIIGTTLLADGKEYLTWSVVDKTSGDFISTTLSESVIVADTLPIGPEKNILKIRRSGDAYMCLLTAWGKETIGKDTVPNKGLAVYLIKCDIDMNISSYIQVGNTMVHYYGYSVIDLELDNSGNAYTLDFVSGKYGGTGNLEKYNSAATALVWGYSGPVNFSSEYADVSVDANGLVLAGHENWVPYGEYQNYGKEVIIKFNTDKTEEWRYENPDLRVAKLVKHGPTLYILGSFAPQTMAFGNTTLTEADSLKRWFIGEMADGAVTGITNKPGKQTLFVSPNPAKDVLTVSAPDFEEGTVLNFYTVAGQLLKTAALQMPNLSIDISAFPSGILFYKVQNKSGDILKNGKLLIAR